MSDEIENKDEEESKEQKGKWIKFVVIIASTVIVIAVLITTLVFVCVYEKSEEVVPEKKEALYVDFPREEIIAILFDKDGNKHHIVIKVVILVRNSKARDQLKTDKELIISEMVELVEFQKYEELHTSQGKENLRKKMLNHLKKIMKENREHIDKVLIVKYQMD